jgi:hypothetical protein
VTQGGTQKKPAGEWFRNRFIYCILEGLKRAKVKPLNYYQVTAYNRSQQNPLGLFSKGLRMHYKSTSPMM